MSNYSGYSLASRLEIARIEQEKNVMALQMADQKAQMAAQEARLISMQAMLLESGLIPGTSAQAHAQDRERALACTKPQLEVAAAAVNNTLSRKRHSSQQLECVVKIGGGVPKNVLKY
jgi:hypothetical protein